MAAGASNKNKRGTRKLLEVQSERAGVLALAPYSLARTRERVASAASRVKTGGSEGRPSSPGPLSL